MISIRTPRPLMLALLLTVFFVPQAHAVSKEMVQLQAQIDQLQKSIDSLRQANDERMGVLKDLVQQTADSVNKMSVTVNGLQLRMQNVQDASTAKSDQLSGQLQSLNDSIDELKARMGRMDKALTDIQSQQQQANAVLNNLPTGNTSPASAGPVAAPTVQTPPQTNAAATVPIPKSTKAPAPNAPAVGDMYRTAYGDYMTGKYPLASSEFTDLIAAYPDDNLAGNAYFYLGEISNRTQKPTAAVKDYDHVLEHYPDNQKIPAAHLHKGEALISMKQNDAGIRELKALIQRFPNSPEASQARARLTALTPRR